MSFECTTIFAPLPRTERGKHIVFGADPKGKNVLYVNGNSVIIRNLLDSADSDIYTQHAVATTVAKYSPSGFYIASGDKNGKVRIWDTTQKEHLLKNEFQPFCGHVNDIAWSSDNQRIAIGGCGKEKFGAVINAETGTNTGEVIGMSKEVNNIDFKSSRPFRLITGAEDFSSCFFEGPPFKFKQLHNDHTNFCNCARYSPDGEVYATAGSDGKIFLYDGKTGEKLGEIGNPAHKGSIYSLYFSPDSKEIVTASGDKSVKVFDVAQKSLSREYAFENNMNNMQLGCIWIGDHILTCSLSGQLNLFVAAELANGPSRVYNGHNKPITSLKFNKSLDRLFTSDSVGNVCVWETQTGLSTYVQGKGHSNQVQSMDVSSNHIVTVGIDDKVIVTPLDQLAYGSPVSLKSQPRAVASVEDISVIACLKEVVILEKESIKSTYPIQYEGSAIALSPDKNTVVLGGSDNNALQVFNLNGGKLTPLGAAFSIKGQMTAIAFSPSGSHIAVTDSDRNLTILTIDCSSGTLQSIFDMKCHSARVNCVDWSPSGDKLVTGSLDCALVVWNMQDLKNKISIQNAHPMSQIVGVAWIDDNTFFSAGQDSSVRKWSSS